MWIRQNPLWLWNLEETSPEVQNRHVSHKNFKKNYTNNTKLTYSIVSLNFFCYVHHGLSWIWQKILNTKRRRRCVWNKTFLLAYPKIGDSSFRCVLWTFKQQFITSFGLNYIYRNIVKRGEMEHEMTLFYAIEPIKKCFVPDTLFYGLYGLFEH